MRKELQIATALAALLAAPVLAQNTPPAAPSTGTQQTVPMPTTPHTPPPAPTAAAPDSMGAAGELRFVKAQQAEEMLASTLLGTPVYNGENQSLGEINDILLDADGQLRTVVMAWAASSASPSVMSRCRERRLVSVGTRTRTSCCGLTSVESSSRTRRSSKASKTAAWRKRRPVRRRARQWRDFAQEALWPRPLFPERHPPLLHSRHTPVTPRG